MFWFHCGRCGSLFQAPIGDTPDRLCQKCGTNPSLELLDSLSPADTPSPATQYPGHGIRHGGKSNPNWHLLLKFIGAWLLVLVLIILAARLLWNEGTPNRPPPAPVAHMSEDSIFLDRSLPACAATFSGFLSAGTPESRNQFVLSPVSTALRMARYYSQNALVSIDPAKLRMVGNAVLDLPGGKAIETHWNTENGQTLDAVFRLEHEEWRLDWDDFARYSDCPWALFLAGSGTSEGEFRLLARERLPEERKDSESLSVVFYAPRFGHPRDTGYQSPEFLMPRHSNNGQLLDAAFKLTRNGGRIFKASLPDLNPEGMIRVRVKARRSEVNMERKFEIIEVLACHWYALDDPGVPVSAPATEPTQDR
jgi:hypothetical protein